jgi:conjugative relaxase-like TrwC/TraI family protein
VGYVERTAAAVRRGSGGAVVEEASGLVAAAFRHPTSRAGDPPLHTHVLVANLGRTARKRPETAMPEEGLEPPTRGL